MGTVGVPEMMVIFLLALVLFGPKELPKLGRTLGKALTEFRRASSDLKSSFEREMQTLEREAESLKETAHNTINDLIKHVDYSDSYDENSHASIESHASDDAPAASHDFPAPTHPSTVGASEASSAESHGTLGISPSETATAVIEARPAVEGTVPRSESSEPVEKHS